MFVMVKDNLNVVPLGKTKEFRACNCFVSLLTSTLYLFPLVAEYQ